MDPERWQQIKTLFEAARELPPEQRDDYLAKGCADDDLRAEVESLLGHDQTGSTFIEKPVLGDDFDLASHAGLGREPSATDIERPGSTIGPYQLVRIIGTGGMGVVYEAQQLKPFRLVALKVIRAVAGIDDETLRRFQRETETLARLRHSAIASIIEAGRTDDDRHYFAMELVRGRDLRTFLQEEHPPRADRLQLFLAIADAVTYAHQRGVIHRDLKPSNIMVDDEGQPKILDFGLARMTDTDVSVHTMVTEVGRIVGTLSYMSPEQARGNPHDIDVRTDVYALGVILFEMLADGLPYEISTGSMPQALSVICEQPPLRLSSITSGLRGDLETIVGKALEKDADRRYQSAAAFADDVRRHLDDEPILARPPSTTYQLGKLIRRHTLPFALTVALFVLSVGFGIFSTIQAVRLADTAEAADAELYRSLITQAQLHLHEPNITRMLEVLDLCVPARRGWEWHWLQAQANPSNLTLTWPETMVLTVDVRSERLIAIRFNREHGLHAWDVLTERLLYTIDGHDAPVPVCVFSANGRLVASGDQAGMIQIRQADSGALLRSFHAFDGAVSAIVFGQDAETIIATGGIPDPFKEPTAFATAHSKVSCWSVSSGETVLTLDAQDVVSALTLSDDGQMIAWGNQNGIVEVFDLTDGTPIASTRMPRMVTSAAWMKTGTELILGLTDSTMRLWNIEDDSEFVWRDHERALAAIATSPDGKCVASADVGGTLKLWYRLWQPAQTESAISAPAHDESRWHVGFSADSRWVCSWSESGQVKFWQVPDTDLEPSATEIAVSTAFAIRLDRQLVVTTLGSDGFALVQIAPYEVLSRFDDGAGIVSALAFALDGQYVAAGHDDGTIHIWTIDDSAAPYHTLDSAGSTVTCLRYAPVGHRLIAGYADGSLRVWTDGRYVRLPSTDDQPITCLAVDSFGDLVCAAGQSGVVRTWRISDGRLLHQMRGHTDTVRTVAFSPNGNQVVSGSDDHTLRIWDTRSGEPLHTLRGHEGKIYAAAFTHDGTRIASGGSSLRIWDAARGTHLLSLRWSSHLVSDIRFLDDDRLLTRSFSGAMRVWDAQPHAADADAVAVLMRASGE